MRRRSVSRPATCPCWVFHLPDTLDNPLKPLRKAIFLATAMTAFTTGSKIASAAEEAGVTLKQLDIIDVTAQGVSAMDSASSGDISHEQLGTRPLLRPGAVLEAVPGLVVTQHSGEGKAYQYFLRGFNLDHGTDLAITVDGMPVNMPTHGHGQGYADINFLIPELIQTVNVRKGPYYADVGDFGSAGAVGIDYVTKLPKNIAEVTVGSFG